MKNFIQPGNVLTAPAPAGGAVSGKAYLIGSLVGVAAVTKPAGSLSDYSLHGVYALDKATGQAWTVGQKLYWDNAAKVFTTVATGNTVAGTAHDAAAAGDVIGNVRLAGIPG